MCMVWGYSFGKSSSDLPFCLANEELRFGLRQKNKKGKGKEKNKKKTRKKEERKTKRKGDCFSNLINLIYDYFFI